MDSKEYFSHPTAIIEEGCSIGKGAKIWHYTHVENNCRIGENTSIGQNVYLGMNVIIGSNVKIQNGVNLFEGVVCENDVFIGPGALITNVNYPRAFINKKSSSFQTLIERGASIGGNATIKGGKKIGQYCLVGAGSVVSIDIPDFAMVLGSPATIKGWVSYTGTKLSFDENGIAVCPDTNEIYKLKNNKVERIKTT